MDASSLVFILLIGVAAVLFYQVFIAPRGAGDEPLTQRTQDQPKKAVTSKRAAAKSGATKKPAHSQSAATTKRPAGKGRAAARPRQKDDLTRIEGIGPKIAEGLTKAGIAQLAGSDMDKLETSVTAGGIGFRRTVAESWPKQARLAKDNHWKALAALQAKLKGGSGGKG